MSCMVKMGKAVAYLSLDSFPALANGLTELGPVLP